MHFFTLMIALMYVIYRYSSLDELPKEFLPLGFIQDLFLIQAWVVPAQIHWNNVSWSVSAEWFAYIFFPLFILFAKLFTSNKSRLFAVVGLYIAMIVVGAGFCLWVLDGVFSLRSVGIFRLIFEFAMGVMTFQVYKNNVHEKPPINGFLLLIIFSTLLMPIGILWAVPLFTWLIYLIANGRFPMNRVLSLPLVVYGGKISYAIYLMHGLFLLLLGRVYPVADYVDSSVYVRLSYMGIYFTLSIASAAIAYHLVEEPLRKIIVRVFGR
jgi:peptidoglycan/LPS O-acetylase OafA/YrhL